MGFFKYKTEGKLCGIGCSCQAKLALGICPFNSGKKT